MTKTFLMLSISYLLISCQHLNKQPSYQSSNDEPDFVVALRESLAEQPKQPPTKRTSTKVPGSENSAAHVIIAISVPLSDDSKEGERENVCTEKQLEGGYEDINGECTLTGWNWIIQGVFVGSGVGGGCKTPKCSNSPWGGGGSGGGGGDGGIAWGGSADPLNEYELEGIDVTGIWCWGVFELCTQDKSNDLTFDGVNTTWTITYPIAEECYKKACKCTKQHGYPDPDDVYDFGLSC